MVSIFSHNNPPLPNINVVRLYHYNINLPIKQLQLFRQVSKLVRVAGLETTASLPPVKRATNLRHTRLLN